MRKDKFIKSLYKSTIQENQVIYQDLFTNTDISEARDSYWKNALKLFSVLSDENKAILFNVIEQVQVDTVSNVLGIIDGVVTTPEVDFEIKVTLDETGELINGELQELFLEYDEEIR